MMKNNLFNKPVENQDSMKNPNSRKKSGTKSHKIPGIILIKKNHQNQKLVKTRKKF